MLSVIITNRNEPMLPFTVRRIQETADCKVEIIVVDDGSDQAIPELPGVKIIPIKEPTGLAYCRDVGIEAASNDACLILDAHMNFHPDNWASYSVEFSQSYREGIGCAVSTQLDSDPWNDTGRQMSMLARREPDPGEKGGWILKKRSAYYGARIETICTKTARPFPCKWNGDYKELIKDGEPGVIQCILGGAYVLSRAWYLQGLQRPWRANRGWGTSEQSIAIPNWLCGGESYLMPIEIGHQYRTGKQGRVPYQVREKMEVQILWNRFKIIEVLPMDEELRRDMHDALRHSCPTMRYQAMRTMDKGYCREYRHFLSRQKRKVGAYFERFGMSTEIPKFPVMEAFRR